MPTAEMYEQEAARLVKERDEARRERDEARARLARIAASRARRDHRRAIKKATASLVARVDAALDLTTVRQVPAKGGGM